MDGPADRPCIRLEIYPELRTSWRCWAGRSCPIGPPPTGPFQSYPGFFGSLAIYVPTTGLLNEFYPGVIPRGLFWFTSDLRADNGNDAGRTTAKHGTTRFW